MLDNSPCEKRQSASVSVNPQISFQTCRALVILVVQFSVGFGNTFLVRIDLCIYVYNMW